jgi:hypothetical protein
LALGLQASPASPESIVWSNATEGENRVLSSDLLLENAERTNFRIDQGLHPVIVASDEEYLIIEIDNPMR